MRVPMLALGTTKQRVISKSSRTIGLRTQHERMRCTSGLGIFVRGSGDGSLRRFPTLKIPGLNVWATFLGRFPTSRILGLDACATSPFADTGLVSEESD
jgi:hypothetical protein